MSEVPSIDERLTERTSKLVGANNSGISFEPEQIIGGKYKVLDLVGQGGMGFVYRVRQIFLNRDFALKLLDTRKNSDSSIRRFQQEAKTASLLNHPNLVQVHDFGLLDNQHPYLVMDYVDGTSLAQRLQEKGPIPFVDALPIFEQICLGLASAHEKGIVHRDIKPSNIMLVTDTFTGDTTVKVVDFGIAKMTGFDECDIQSLTRTGEVFGSPFYMSPEQCNGEPVDCRSDIYSLGCVIYEALTGAPPHMGQTALNTMMMHQSVVPTSMREASLGKDFPQALEHVVGRMLKKSANDRYPNLNVVAREIADLSSTTTNSKQLKSLKKSEPKVTKMITMSSVKFSSILGATIFLTSVASLLCGYNLGRTKNVPADPTSASQSPSHSAVASPVVPASLTQNRPTDGGEVGYRDNVVEEFMKASKGAAKSQVETLEHVDRITSVPLIDENGVPSRKFVFPKAGFGMICPLVTDLFDYDWRKKRPASGVDISSTAQPLAFMIKEVDYPGFIAKPDILKKVGENEFQGLKLVHSWVGDGGSVNESPAERKSFFQLLNIASNWTELGFLDLQNTWVGDQELAVLKKMTKLKTLWLRSCAMDMEKLPQLELLSKLHHVRFSNSVGLEPVIEKLQSSPNLVTLELVNTEVNPDTVAHLASCKSLRRFTITEQQFSDKLAAAIGKLQHPDVEIASIAATPTQIQMIFQGNPNLKLHLTDHCYSQSTRQDLMRRFRTLKFEKDPSPAYYEQTTDRRMSQL